MSSRFGRQPIYEVLHEQRWEVKRFAREHGIDYQHLINALTGRTAVSIELQRLLPEALGVPLDAMFVPQSIREGVHSSVALVGDAS